MSAPEWYACRSCERDVYAPNDPSPREADEVCAECHDLIADERYDEWWAEPDIERDAS